MVFQDPNCIGTVVDSSYIFSTNIGELFIILKDCSVKKVAIHIVDISSRSEDEGYPKFHIYECKEIKKQRNMKRQHRYKASTREGNRFYLIKNDKKWYKESLEICSYCLEQYNSQFNFNKTAWSFSIEEWMEEPIDASNLFSVELDVLTTRNRYPDNWYNISKQIRERKNYICQNCKQDFSNEECKKFLHVHHIDANKENNSPENLQVLCIECHSKEHNHGHIKDSPMYEKWLGSKCNPVNRRDY